MNANKKNFYAYNRNLQPFANRLRKEMTKAEACLWKYALRAGMRKGYGFRRQRPVLEFIADFMCLELKLVIEVDGITHTSEETVERDKRKEDRLREAGFHILRFDDDEILNNINWVVEAIDLKIEEIERNEALPLKKRRQRVKTTPLPPPAGDNLTDET
ncbi:MAG: endonuclease domain-containing protein [Cyclobacteriaceae bacterium]|nr:MAG: endonuclease domain-containing protein [Cyclobacteriaceae bacterium]